MKYIFFSITLIILIIISIFKFFPKIAESQVMFWFIIAMAIIIAFTLVASFILELKKFLNK